MKIFLIPDPAAPNGQDAFCRELLKIAPERGHQARALPVPADAAPDDLAKILSEDFAASADILLINGVQPGIFMAARTRGKKVAFRLIESGAAQEPATLQAARDMARVSERLLLPSLHMAAIAKTWGCNGNIRIVPYAYDRIMAGQIALMPPRAAKPATFPLIACAALNESSRPGLETLFSAMARLRLDCHLSLVGDGPLQDALRARTRDFFISDRVAFLGALHPARVGDCLRTAKAFVDPCGLEGFPNWALQALAEGCPVIAAKTGANPEIINNDQNGLTFAAGDATALAEAIVSLYSQRGLSLRLIAEGVKTVERHGWPRTAAAALEAIEDIA